MEPKVLKGILALTFATLIWGLTFVFIKDAVSVLTPFQFLLWRFALSAVIACLLFARWLKFSKALLYHGIILGILLAGIVFFQTIGLQYTKASTASFLTGASVILVPIFEALINKQPISKATILSIILSFSGIGLITLEHENLTINVGDLWILLCTFFMAGYIVYAGIATKLKASLTLTTIQTIFVALLASIMNICFEPILIPSTLKVWVAIIFCGLFATVIAFVLQIKFQKLVTPTQAAFIFALEPVFATIAAALYLKERITFQFVVGALLIFAAILLSQFATIKMQKKSHASKNIRT